MISKNRKLRVASWKACRYTSTVGDDRGTTDHHCGASIQVEAPDFRLFFLPEPSVIRLTEYPIVHSGKWIKSDDYREERNTRVFYSQCWNRIVHVLFRICRHQHHTPVGTTDTFRRASIVVFLPAVPPRGAVQFSSMMRMRVLIRRLLISTVECFILNILYRCARLILEQYLFTIEITSNFDSEGVVSNYNCLQVYRCFSLSIKIGPTRSTQTPCND